MHSAAALKIPVIRDHANWSVASRSNAEYGYDHKNIGMFISQDRQTLIINGGNGTVKIWDLATGTCRQILKVHLKFVKGMAVSADGKTIVSYTNQYEKQTFSVSKLEGDSYKSTFFPKIRTPVNAVCINDTGTRCVLQTLQGNLYSVNLNTLQENYLGKTLPFGAENFKIPHNSPMAMANDGNTLIIAGEEGKILICTLKDNNITVTKTINSKQGGITHLVFNSITGVFATGAVNGMIKLWNLASATELATLTFAPPESNTYLCDLKISTDGNSLISAKQGEKGMVIWDLTTYSIRHTLLFRATGCSLPLVISPDNRSVIIYSEEHDITLWDIYSGELLHTFDHNKRSTSPPVFSADGQKIYLAYETGLVIYDTRNSTSQKIIEGCSRQEKVIPCADGKTLMSTESDGITRFWDIVSGASLKAIPPEKGYTKIISANKRMVAFTQNDNCAIQIWDTLHLKLLHTIPLVKDVYPRMAFSDDGNYFAYSNSKESMIYVLQYNQGTWNTCFTHQIYIGTLCFSPDGQTLVGANDRGQVYVYNIPTMKLTQKLKAVNRPESNGSYMSQSILFNHSGSLFISIIGTDQRKFWSNVTGQWQEISPPLDLRHLGFMRFTTGDKYIVSTLERKLQIWDMQQEDAIVTLDDDINAGNTASRRQHISCSVLSNNGRLLVEGYKTGELYAWDLQSLPAPPQKITLQGHPNGISDLAFSLDGQLLIAAADTGFQYYDVRAFQLTPYKGITPLNIPGLSPYVAPVLPPRPITPPPPPAPPAFQTIPYGALSFDNPKKELGRGTFGVVYRGWLGDTEVAVKELHSANYTPPAVQAFEQEATLHGRLRHQHIVLLHGAVTEKPRCLVIEFMQRSLHNLLHDPKEELSWPVRIRLGTEIAQGLEYLHTNGIIHRDLKSANVLLDPKLVVKITDFGLARVKSEAGSMSRVEAAQGTVAWMAPESLSPKPKYSTKSDIYSLGMTLWELASREIPYVSGANQQVIMGWILQGVQEEFPENTPPELSEIAKGCWALKPENRPEIPAILARLAQCSQNVVINALTVATIGFADNLDSGPPSSVNITTA